MTRFSVPGRFQKSLSGEAAQCLTCERTCVLGPGDWGTCRTRRNIGGVVHTTTWRRRGTTSLNPVEKKPLYHFHPGTSALTYGAPGCNFKCFWCQNHDLSQRVPPPGASERPLTPEEFVGTAKELGAAGTSLSFSEPTLALEFALELFPLARREGLYNTFVTNGYLTVQALDALVEAGLDAVNVDVKGDEWFYLAHCGAALDKVLRNVSRLKSAGVHVELATLVLPGLNDDPAEFADLCDHVLQAAGSDAPWHVNRFFPRWKARERGLDRPTPVATLEELASVAKRAGFDHVYVGNVPGHRGQNTTCPACGHLLVRREYPRVQVVGLRVERGGPRERRVLGYCDHCGASVPGRW
ncbi:MAG: AmmeMemoRadiSam system radical SAM enzyme [Promethearchaeota archaeon]